MGLHRPTGHHQQAGDLDVCGALGGEFRDSSPGGGEGLRTRERRPARAKPAQAKLGNCALSETLGTYCGWSNRALDAVALAWTSCPSWSSAEP